MTMVRLRAVRIVYICRPISVRRGLHAEQIGAVLAWTGLPQLILIPLVPRLMHGFDTRYIAFTG